MITSTITKSCEEATVIETAIIIKISREDIAKQMNEDESKREEEKISPSMLVVS